MQNTINERVKNVAHYFFKGNASAMAKAMDIKQPTLRDIIGEKQSAPSYETLKKIADYTSDLSLDWLLTGEGDMLKEKKEPLESNAKLIENANIMFVPFVGQYAQAGYPSGFMDVNYLETLPKIPFIVDHEAKGNYLSFEVSGDSMNDGTEDSYIPGDKVLCREIYPDYWAKSRIHINKWDFVIVTNDGIIIKRIIDHDVENHLITVHSLNDMYPDKVIDLTEVKQIFNVIEISRSKRR